MAEFEHEQQDENSSSFWSSFTKRIAEVRKSLKSLKSDHDGYLEILQNLRLQLSSLQVCELITASVFVILIYVFVIMTTGIVVSKMIMS